MKDRIAIEETEFKRLMKTYKIVWNHKGILNTLSDKIAGEIDLKWEL